MKLNRPSLIALLFFVIWEALYMSILYILERRFPDAAFFAQDTTAPFWVGLGGAVLSIAGGELFRKDCPTAASGGLNSDFVCCLLQRC